jgi:cytochrome c
MSNDLRLNTILGCGLAAALGVLGLREASVLLYEPHYPEVAGFAPDVEIAASSTAEAAAPRPIDFGGLYADAAQYTALVDRGTRLAAACKACHSFDAGGANGTGPALYGVVGRPTASVAGFDYSEAMAAHEPPWTYEELSNFLANPSGYIRGTKMAYAGLRKPEDRAAMIAYLREQAPSPAPLPPPLPVEAPVEAPAPEGAAPVAPSEDAVPAPT